MKVDAEVTKVEEAGLGASVTCRLTREVFGTTETEGEIRFRVASAQVKSWGLGRRATVTISPVK